MYHFFAYISRMKHIQRWGLMRNAIPENDMEHALQTAMVAHALALYSNQRHGSHLDANHVMALALYHDASEVITGDLPTPIKHHNPDIRREYNKLEEGAADRLLRMLPADLRSAYTPLLRHDESTEEWKHVKAADRICAYIKCVEELKLGNREFASAKDSIEHSIRANPLPAVRDFMCECLPGFGLSLDEISIDVDEAPTGEQEAAAGKE